MNKKKFFENHLARILALQYLFQFFQNKEFARDTSFFEPDSIVAEIFDEETHKFNRQLYVDLIELIIENFEDINQEIGKVAVERPVEEIDLLTRIGIALALVEVRILKNIPPKVAIDEAIEIDKELNSGEMYKLINAVLGKLFGLDKKMIDKSLTDNLNKILGLQLDPKIALQALTHRSTKNIKESFDGSLKVVDNERLEFLGDAVLELIVTTYLYEKYVHKSEGELTSLRSAIVKTESLAQESKRLGFDKLIIMSPGEENTGGRKNNYLLANAFEAIIGAIYICFGYDAAKDFVTKELLYKLEDIISTKSHKNPKTDVQEIVQEFCKITPVYKLEEETGPDHNKQFKMTLYIGPIAFTKGVGSSKQRAELNAAKKFLEKKDEYIDMLSKLL